MRSDHLDDLVARTIASVAVAPLGMYDPLPVLREIKAPIRAINSDLFPTNVEVNRKYVPGYQAAIMKGVGHYLMLELPEAFNALLAEALRELARSGGRR